jgi:hypothetical protein
MFKAKFFAMLNWIMSIARVLKNRGNASYGSANLEEALDFFVLTRRISFNDSKSAENFVLRLLPVLHPKISPLKIIRFGPNKDSGYFIALGGKIEYVISGGAGKNIDFEFQLANTGAIIHIFDPFVRSLPIEHPLIKHYKIKLTNTDNSSSTKALGMKELENHIHIQPEKINLLKLDIEGSEINLLGSSNVDLNIYDEIVIEVHELFRITDDNFRKKFEQLIINLTRNHYVISFNANNNGLLLNFGSYFLPEIFELTLLNHKYFDKSKVDLCDTKDLSQVVNNLNRLPIPNIFDLNNQTKLRGNSGK